MTLKQMIVAALFLLSLGWVALMDVVGKGKQPTDDAPRTFKDDGTLRATITNIDNSKFHVTASLRVQDRDIGMVRQPELALKRLALGLRIVEFAHQQLGINSILDGRNHAIDLTPTSLISLSSALLSRARSLLRRWRSTR